MKINSIKPKVISLILTILVLSKSADAQKDNQETSKQDVVTTEQQDQVVQQHNNYQHKHNYKKHNQQEDQQKNIEAQRVAFITKEVGLTPDEAKVFWPVYNEYESKRHELRKSFKKTEDLKQEDFDKLTDKEATQILDKQIIEAQKYLDLRKEYHAKFKAILPPVKVLKLYDAEREFQKILMDKMRQHKKPSPPPSNNK